MSARRFLWAAAITAVLALAVSPVSCSQASDTGSARSDTLLGYWTPVGEGAQLLFAVAVLLAAFAYGSGNAPACKCR